MLTGSPPLPRVGCRIPLPLPPSLVLYRVLPPPVGVGVVVWGWFNSTLY